VPAAPQARTTPPPAPAPAPAPVANAATVQDRDLVARVQEDFVRQAFVDGKATFTLLATKAEIEKAGSDEALGLTPSQKTAIDSLRSQRDAAIKGLEDRIESVTDQTEQSIRGLLTPEQLAKYDADRAPVQETLTVEAVAPALNASGQKPGYLGINGGDAQGGGATVTQVFPNTVAAGLGLQKDDVILEFNGQPVAGLSDLATKIRESGEGSPANLKIRRGGTEFYQGLQLGGWPK
jgi:C-terminal processing protease CtpA/Prc